MYSNTYGHVVNGIATSSNYTEALVSVALSEVAAASEGTVEVVVGNANFSPDTVQKIFVMRCLTRKSHFTRFVTVDHRLNVNILTVAGVVVLLYDLFLTFPDELQYVWRRRLSFRKLVYIINRYGMVSTMIYYLSGMYAEITLTQRRDGVKPSYSFSLVPRCGYDRCMGMFL